MAVQPTTTDSATTSRATPTDGTTANPQAWQYALGTGAVMWLALAVVLFGVMHAPFMALSFAAPLALGAGLVGLLASRLPVRLPAVAYPLLVAAIAVAANAPVLELVWF